MCFRTRNLRSLALLTPALAFALLSLLGCGGQSSRFIGGAGSGGGSGSGSGSGAGSITLSYDGTSFTDEYMDATLDNGVFGIGASRTTDGVTRTLQIIVMNAEAGSTYSFELINPNVAVWSVTEGTSAADVTSYAGTSGQIHFDTFDSNGASGTFHFTGTKSIGTGPENVAITAGTFDVSF